MFLKQTTFKPRSNSQSSPNNIMSDENPHSTDTQGASLGGKGASSSNNSEPGGVKGGASTTPTGANTESRRRSSGSSPFSGLSTQKRNSGDATMDAKKASFMEQKPGSGNPIQNMWNSFTKGPTGSG